MFLQVKDGCERMECKLLQHAFRTCAEDSILDTKLQTKHAQILRKKVDKSAGKVHINSIHPHTQA